jgi:CheY-like chemotaxis protein
MSHETILIVEDDPVQREGLTAMLSQRGFSVVAVADGQEALELLEHDEPDLVLLDMLIPNEKGDGWWFLKRRRQDSRLASIPVVIITAMSVASKDWANSLGADELIRKPFAAEPLLAVIQHCLSHD